MSDARLISATDGWLKLQGTLDFDSVPRICREGRALIKQFTEINVDLEQVAQSNSAGLALMTDWYREARRQQKKISFHHVPQHLKDLGRVSGIDDVIIFN